ncbi:hypothetical protein N9S81_00420, partial [bacterium]|nr:hypothetical protein [bacterium]
MRPERLSGLRFSKIHDRKTNRRETNTKQINAAKMSSAIVLASPTIMMNTCTKPLSSIEANVDDFVVRIPNSKLLKFVRITDSNQITNKAISCLELEPWQLQEIKASQGHCMAGTTTKALSSGFEWLVDRTNLPDCICQCTVDGVSELYLRACTRAPADPENKAEQKAYKNDQAMLWRINFETLKLFKPLALSKDSSPYPSIDRKHFVYEFFKHTKEVPVEDTVAGANRQYLETEYPRILDFADSMPKTMNASMASSKKAMDAKLDIEYTKTQLPTDKLLRGHFVLNSDTSSLKRKQGAILCFEVSNSNQVEMTKIGKKTLIMITPTHNILEESEPGLAVGDVDDD